MDSISTEFFDARSVPSEIYNLTDDEKTNFDLSETPETNRTYSICYIAVTYNPRKNIKHVPLNIFGIDDTLLFYNTYKRFYNEVPDSIERKVIENYVGIKCIDVKTLVKYVKALEYPAKVYYDMLRKDMIKYSDIPLEWRLKLITEIRAREHQELIKQKGWNFTDIPRELQLCIFDKSFIKFMLDRNHYTLSSIPEGYKPKKKTKQTTVNIPQDLLSKLTPDQTQTVNNETNQ